MYKELEGNHIPQNDATLSRYMNFEKFVNILATESLFFTRADKFDDPFEGFTPPLITDIYNNAVNRGEYDFGTGLILKFLENWRKYVMCNCWYQGEKESLPMWEKYQVRESGIAIKTTMGNFKSSLQDELYQINGIILVFIF